MNEFIFTTHNGSVLGFECRQEGEWSWPRGGDIVTLAQLDRSGPVGTIGEFGESEWEGNIVTITTSVDPNEENTLVHYLNFAQA